MRTSRQAYLLMATLVATAAISTGLLGCTAADPLSEQYQQSNERSRSADGRLVEIPIYERGAVVSFSGTTEYGNPVLRADYAGQVYFANSWNAAYVPCIIKAPMLEEVWQSYQDEGVGFLDENIYDQPATAVVFAEENGITDPAVGERKVQIEYAGPACQEDLGLERAIEQLRDRHLSATAEQPPSPHFKKGTP